MAKVMRMHQSQVSRIENGERSITSRNRERLEFLMARSIETIEEEMIKSLYKVAERLGREKPLSRSKDQHESRARVNIHQTSIAESKAEVKKETWGSYVAMRKVTKENLTQQEKSWSEEAAKSFQKIGSLAASA